MVEVNWSVFMVLGPSEMPKIREFKSAYRWTICLKGEGTWGLGHRVAPGELIPVMCDDPRIEWLDEE